MRCGHGSSKALGQSQSSFLNNRQELKVIDAVTAKTIKTEIFVRFIPNRDKTHYFSIQSAGISSLCAAGMSSHLGQVLQRFFFLNSPQELKLTAIISRKAILRYFLFDFIY